MTEKDVKVGQWIKHIHSTEIGQIIKVYRQERVMGVGYDYNKYIHFDIKYIKNKVYV